MVIPGPSWGGEGRPLLVFEGVDARWQGPAGRGAGEEGRRWGGAVGLVGGQRGAGEWGVLVGGTGACVFTPWIVNKDKNEALYTSVRFIGCTDADDKDPEGTELLSPLGVALRTKLYGPDEITPERREQILEMPMEIFSYV